MNRLFILAILLLASQWVHAGGNTSIVDISSVTSLKIEARKITIVGTGVVRFPVMTTAEHQTNSDKVFGQRVQWVYAKTTDGVFEVIPYNSRSDIEGVPTGGHSDEELKALSVKFWAEAVETCKRIKVGDRITIGYEGDQRLLGGYRVKSATGWDSVTIQPNQVGAEPNGAGRP